jgi:hypothetical protein
MKSFNGDVILEEMKNGYWKLQEYFSYENDYLQVTVKSDFITDGASIPKIFWSVVGSPLENDLLKPAIIHDGLYTANGLVTIMRLKRSECDKLLREMLLFNGTSKVKAYSIYYAVRLFGGSHWKKDTTDMMKFVQIKGKDV